MQRRISFDAMLAAPADQRINIRGKIARQKHHDVAVAGSQLRRSRKLHLSPWRCPGPVSGLIHAVIVPSAVAACTAPATRVRQMLPPLDSTSIGPATYMMRIPPPPVCARTDPCTSPKSICPPPVRTFTKLPGVSHGNISAVGIQLGSAADLPRPNVPAAAAQRGVSRDIAQR